EEEVLISHSSPKKGLNFKNLCYDFIYFIKGNI
ncbi:hypothetical protein cje100_01648, partial [Campylobacter jejuni subsp. jejuni LMG 23216]